MELRHIYKLSDIINESILENKIPKEILKDTVINVKVSPTTLYGIDKEFHRLTHDNSDEGFKHSDTVEATISNVHFKITTKVGQ